MYRKGQIIAAMITNTIILLVISRLATGSLNPWEVFRGDSLLLKVVAGLLCFGLLASVWRLVLIAGPLSDVVCARVKPEPPCGKNLLEFAAVFGNPMRCPICRRWFHMSCFRANGGTMLEGCKQPNCPSGRSAFEDFSSNPREPF